MKRLSFIISLTGLVLCGVVVYNLIPNQAPQIALSGSPVRIIIPAINVSAVLESVGLTSEGAVDVPKDPAHAAWYNLGPRPGETGNAIIDGHYTWKNRTAAVFDNLHRLHMGDKIYTQDEKGTTTAFAVRELRTYGPDADAPDVFTSTDTKTHLNLITCQGTWNSISKSYSSRLVVFADGVAE